MKSLKTKKFKVVLMSVVVVLLSSIFILFYGSTKPGCGPVKPEEPVCFTPLDCEGLPHIMCLGKWLCMDGQCVWQCKPPEPKKCIKTGCSGEVCAEESVYTPCVFQPWYECLKFSECGPFGKNNSCEWKETPEFIECLKKYKKECDSSTPCPEGFKCVEGKCVPAEKECLENEDCPPGEYCKKDPKCYLMNSAPDEIFICKGVCEKIPWGECAADKDCKKGYHCEFGPCPLCIDCPCFGKCVKNGDIEGCKEDEDCGYGYECKVYCGNGWCKGFCELKEGFCWVDEDCPEGFFCPPLDCKEGADCIGPYKCEPKGKECLNDEDCEKGEFCKKEICPPCISCPCYGKCVLKEGFCWSDKDCDEGYYCEIVKCLDGKCIGPYKCVLKEGFCWVDEDCPEGFFCPPLDCKEGADCIGPYKCVPKEKECLNDKDCDEGYKCENGKCVLKEGFCWSDKDCPDGYYCEIVKCLGGKCIGPYKCVPKGKECLNDKDCPAGQYCKYDSTFCKEPLFCDGICTDNPEGMCVKNEDCEKGEFCKKEICPLCVNCPCFGKCVPQLGECKEDNDCPPGFYCDPCGCPPGAYCFACIPKCMLPQPCDPDKGCKWPGYECKCMPDPNCPLCDVCKFGCVPKLN